MVVVRHYTVHCILYTHRYTRSFEDEDVDAGEDTTKQTKLLIHFYSVSTLFYSIYTHFSPLLESFTLFSERQFLSPLARVLY